MNQFERINHIKSAGIAENTIRSYESDLRYFWGWVKITRGGDVKYPVSPGLIEAFILDHIEGLDQRTDRLMVENGFKAETSKLHAVNTVKRRLKGISWMHRINNFENPIISQKTKELLKAAKRVESKSGRVPRRSRAITKDILIKIISTINTRTLIGKRNKAILEFGFYTGGRRRSEVASAEYRFLTESQGGYIYLLHRSKTDQSGKGRKKILRSKYSQSLKAWIKAADITDGYLFRSIKNNKITKNPINPQVVNNIIKEHIEMIGENPKYYSAHGLRRGFITTCGRLGLSIYDVMQLTDHKDIKTLYGYYEEGRIHRNQATKI